MTASSKTSQVCKAPLTAFGMILRVLPLGVCLTMILTAESSAILMIDDIDILLRGTAVNNGFEPTRLRLCSATNLPCKLWRTSIN